MRVGFAITGRRRVEPCTVASRRAIAYRPRRRVMTSRSPSEAGSNPLEAARRLAPELRASAAVTEQERRLPAHLVAALTDAGIFRMCVPRALGGGEVDPATLVETLAVLAE